MFEDEAKELYLDLGREELEHKKQDRKERKRYAGRIFNVVVWCLSFIGLVILLKGFLGAHDMFDFSDSALIALLTTTTANVLAMLYVVIRHFFLDLGSKRKPRQ